MRKHILWLQKEIESWVKEGFITPDQADQIRSRYPVTAALPWATIIFSGLGSLILGLGIILLFAYNWEVIPHLAKLGIIFATLIAIHLVGLRLQWKSSRFQGVGESLNLLGTMLFGAGIWLVAQIYHLNEHYPNAFLAWGMGALALAWAFPSIAQAILAIVLLTIWAGCESFAFDTPTHLVLPALLSLGIIAWKRNSATLTAILVPGFTLSLSFILMRSDMQEMGWLSCMISIGTLLLAKSRIIRLYENRGLIASWLSFYGWAFGCGVVFCLTFPRGDYVPHPWYFTGLSPLIISYLLILAAGAVVACGYVFHLHRLGKLKLRMEDGLLPLSALLIAFQTLLPSAFSGWISAAAFNLVFLAIAASLMARGCRLGLMGPTVVGALLLIALTMARYMDLFQSLLARGFTFLIVGAIIFAEGIFYTKSRKKKKEDES